MKHCPVCNQDLPESAFGLDNGRADKLNPWCKACKNRKQREKWAADPKHRADKAEKRRAYLADPVKHEEHKAKQRAWRQEKKQDAEYQASERERTSWANRTPEQKQRKRETNRVWAEANREHFNKLHRDYVKNRRKTDPQFKKDLRSRSVRYQTTKRANGGSFTAEEWDTLCLLCGGRCVKCGQIAKLEVDHIVPVSAGGRNDIENIQPLCRSCNSRKGTETIDYRSLMLIGSMGLSLQNGG